MTLPEYLLAAPWWHWFFAFLIALALSRWRPFKIVKRVETHEHKHVHTTKETP